MRKYEYNTKEKIIVLGRVPTIAAIASTIKNSLADASRKSSKVSVSSKLDENMATENSVYVLCGGCGLSKETNPRFMDELNGLELMLESIDSYLHIIRGCEDNPSFFKANSLPFKRVIPIEDYSVIKVDGASALCVGGGISLNKSWKLSHKESSAYYEDEALTFNADEMERAIKELGETNYVITTVPPSFVDATTNDLKNISWLKNDKNLLKDVIEERCNADKVYSYLFRNNISVIEWVYKPFFNSTRKSTLNNITFNGAVEFSNRVLYYKQNKTVFKFDSPYKFASTFSVYEPYLAVAENGRPIREDAFVNNADFVREDNFVRVREDNNEMFVDDVDESDAIDEGANAAEAARPWDD